jgi:hypothetical protein
MANQVDPATAEGAASSGAAAQGPILAAQDASMVHGNNQHGSVPATTNVAQLGPHPPFHGRTVSWVAVSIIMAGFSIGGLALIFGQHGPTWWLFWIGVGVSVLGILLTLATNTFEDWY